MIGSFSLLGTFLVMSSTPKAPNILGFVVITSIISTALGIGILKVKRVAYDLLIYFSSVILLSKLLIFMNIIELNGALETALPASFTNVVSFLYHGIIILYLKRIAIRHLFYRNESLAAPVNLEKLQEVSLE